MPVYTAEQFKQLLATTGRAQNITVEEDVLYLMDEQTHLHGDVKIIGCNLKSLYIADQIADTLTITGGKTWRLNLETQSRFKAVTIKNCIIDYFRVDETTITDLHLFPAENNRPTFECVSSSTNVRSILLEGNFKEINLNQISTTNLHLKKVIVNTIKYWSTGMTNLILENVKGNNFRFQLGREPEPDVLTFKVSEIKYFTNITDLG